MEITVKDLLARNEKAPLNISLLVPTKEQLNTIRPVKVLDIFDGPGGNFHDDGLFSTLTFGRVGDPDRDRRFGYIPLHLPVLHPVIYSRLIKLKGLYKGILSGKEYALWDDTTKDFVQSNPIDGKTGYQFFMSHWDALTPPKTGSASRDIRVSLIEGYRDKAQFANLLVMPAGLRDADIDPDGRVSMDEVNDIYQSVIMQVRNLPDKIPPSDLPLYDRQRFSLTLTIVKLYDYIENLNSGKGGFIQSRWASRRVFNGTRNVLSSYDSSAADLDAPNKPGYNDTVVGIYQASRAVLPQTVHRLKTSFVGDIFDTASNMIELVEPKTLKKTWVEISNEDMDRWGTDEGLEKVVNELSVVEKRHREVVINNHYLALVYVDDQQNYRILRGIEELPETFDTKWVRPITYIELIYLTGLDLWYGTPAFVTRYPVTGMYSSIPTKSYVKTTVVGELRYPLNNEWARDNHLPLALEYPVFEEDTPKYHDSTSVPGQFLEPLGADFDGDTVSYIATYSEESRTEAHNYFKSRRAYIQAGGGMAFSTNIHTLKLTLRFMTGEPE